MSTWSERPADILIVASAKAEREAVRQVRRETIVPLVLLIDPTSEEQQAELLTSGADFIAQRPYSARLLISQIQALLRRAGSAPLTTLPTLSLPGLTLDPETREVLPDGMPARRLTHLEFRLLYALMVNRGQVLPTETLVERIWGYTGEGDRDLVRGLISRLRAKIEVDSRHPRFIHTLAGVGYVFRDGIEE
jgi:DNA-binding response OmpR family regulator